MCFAVFSDLCEMFGCLFVNCFLLGSKCSECARGYYGAYPYCTPCGECFNDWDKIVGGLREKVDQLIGWFYFY